MLRIIDLAIKRLKRRKSKLAEPVGPLASPPLSLRQVEQMIAACIPVPRTDSSGSRRQRSKLVRKVGPHSDTLFLGDSLLANWEAGPKVHNLAVGGDCVQNTMWMLLNMSAEAADYPFRRVMILVGTNNITRKMGSAATCAALRLLWQLVRDRWPEAEVVAMTIPFREDIRSDDGARRRINKWIRSHRSLVSSILNIDAALAEGSVVLENDGLHLSATAYAMLQEHIDHSDDTTTLLPVYSTSAEAT